ncbi:AAC(3) family N-acetyltransferase [Halorubrum coriense]|uniref:AAC(3) family N-acetyltransferase n=1 Tax=Halorubrum coriense TaxID=64713 RepID=UPI00067822F5|nr:AAC(3) family N-acetyltransferase [Halorubrum coriense]
MTSTKLRVYANAALHYGLERNWDRTVTPASADRFERIVSDFADYETVFVHAGLSDVKQAFQCDPYDFLLRVLDENFENILVPGFTPAFRDSAVYHKEHSRPAFGAFSRLFLDDAEYRTDDAIHSILVKGDYRFDDCDHHDSFSEAGCWASLDRDDVLILNVGTDWIVSTQHHFLERHFDVPYVSSATHDGVLFDGSGDHEQITQVNYEYTMPMKRNSLAIQTYLAETGALTKHDLQGLNVMAISARDLREGLAPAVDRDPYFMVACSTETLRADSLPSACKKSLYNIMG